VSVNRIWRWHFGAGLVASTDNFGSLGERASHPELLDWLARRFTAEGWSVKAMHRLIMNSAAYQQSSRITSEADSERLQRIDPDNRLLARFPVRRLEAEEIRDALMFVSGRLDAAMGGKTTNLVQVHDHVQTAAGNKGKLVSLATSSDRTLFFDFLPIEAMSIKGFKTKFQLYTVPGQVIYNTTRQLVLRGVDGIVFVADSQYEKMAENVESFQNLQDNLKSLKLKIDDIPYVLQYNKRDLPNVAPVEYMDYLLNNRDIQVPSFTGCANKCEGVFESLNMITRMLLHKFVNQSQPQYA